MFKTCDLAMTSEVHYDDQGLVNGTYHFKILIPSVAAGAIIGKKGGIIAQLQEETGTKVKMSKATDFYPGTTERVCLISGSVESILTIHEFIMLKIIERSDPNAKTAIDFDHKQLVERNKQVKILVPNSTAAMVIGKGGSYINQIKEESGAYVQISQNDKDRFTLAERCITVIGEMENNIIACRMILAKIVQDPNSGSCLHVSYAAVMGPVPNFDPIGSPFANIGTVPCSTLSNPSTSNSSCATNTLQNPHSSIMPLTGVRMGNSSFPFGSDPQIIETIKTQLRSSGYSEQATSEIGAAMNTLANYGLLVDLGILIGTPAANNLAIPIPNSTASSCTLPSGDMLNQDVYASGTAMNGVESAYNSVAIPGPMGTSSNMFDPADSVGFEVSELGFGQGFTSPPSHSNDCSPIKIETGVYEPFRRTCSVLPSQSAAVSPVNTYPFTIKTGCNPEPPSVRRNYISSGCQTVNTEFNPEPRRRRNMSSDCQTADIMKINIEVDENIARAMHDPRGMSVADIAGLSRASIQITKKAASASGTLKYVITISGDRIAVDVAHHLLQTRIVQEKDLAQQGALR